MSGSPGDELLHRSHWTPLKLGQPPGRSPAGLGPGRWLIRGDHTGLADALSEELRRAGAQPAAAAGASGASLGGILDLRTGAPGELDAGEPCALGADAGAECVDLLRLAQECHAAAPGGAPPPRLVVVTAGAQAIDLSRPVHPAQAPIWGTARMVAFEHPELRLLLLDLDPAEADPGRQARDIVAAIAALPDEEEIAFWHGAAYAHRIVPAELGALGSGPARVDGAHVVTGGLGGLGLTTAGWLADAGAEAIALLSRHPPDERQQQALRKLRQPGRTVEHLCADVAIESDVAGALDRVRGWGLPIRGVVHAAATIDPGPVDQTDPTTFDRVFAPKAVGALHLHRHTREDPLSHFVMYSSCSAIAGHLGQASYGAANALLDALAAYRRQQGLPGLSIGWGAWSGVGYAAERNLVDRYVRFGLTPIAPATGTRLLGRLLATEHPQIACIGGDWRRYTDMVWFGSPPPRLRELIGTRGAGEPNRMR
jgi:hypothetical protein